MVVTYLKSRCSYIRTVTKAHSSKALTRDTTANSNVRTALWSGRGVTSIVKYKGGSLQGYVHLCVCWCVCVCVCVCVCGSQCPLKTQNFENFKIVSDE